MLQSTTISFLKDKKNLLAFSAGGDSTALFFLLLENDLPFDIAIVNYNRREQAKEEVTYAKALAKRYKKLCFVLDAPKITKNFEAYARKIRYDFFETLIKEHGYDTLLTAHHLGDRLEWFLRQLCKGSGCVELAGMQKMQTRNGYTLIRPLLDVTKEEILAYLKQNSIVYFHDETNDDETYERNFFRHNFAAPLLKRYAKGVKQSFSYIDEDISSLCDTTPFALIGDFAYKQATNPLADMRSIDRFFKQNDHSITANEKTLLKQMENTLIARKYLVVFYKGYIFIAPYDTTQERMPKDFKEECRKLAIEPKLRHYLYRNETVYKKIKSLTQAT